MKTPLIAAIVGVVIAALMTFATPVMASNVDVSIDIGTSGFYAPPPEPVFVLPEPIYVEQDPVYIQPRPVYVQPRPYYVEPTTIYVVRDRAHRGYWKSNHRRYRRHDDDDD